MAWFSKSSKKNTPSFIRSGYLESVLHRPQLQYLVAPFLLIRFLFSSLVLSIFLRFSTAFKILHLFVCPHFNPSMKLGCFPVSRDNLFLERKRSAIDQALEAFIEKMPAKNKLEASKLTTWRESVLAMAKEKIEQTILLWSAKNITSLSSWLKEVFLTQNLKHIQKLHIPSRK